MRFAKIRLRSIGLLMLMLSLALPFAEAKVNNNAPQKKVLISLPRPAGKTYFRNYTTQKSFNTKRAYVAPAPRFDNNASTLANTTWKLNFFECKECETAEKEWLCTFNGNGEGKLNNISITWNVKKDTVQIVPNDDSICPFKEVILVNPNTMYGSQLCHNGTNLAYFTATKVVNPLTVFDRTHQFRSGFERYNGKRNIDAIIVHSSFCRYGEDNNLDCVLQQFKQHRVSAHYLIDREGYIYRLVDENNVAFHAGFGNMPDGYNWINHRSIGVELINSEKEGANEAQYQALAQLVQDIRSRYRIKYIRGHNHIAPGRKSDPWLFNWKKFYGMMGGA